MPFIDAGVKLLEESVGEGDLAERGDTVAFECAGYLRRGDCIQARSAEEVRVGRRDAIPGLEKSLIGMRVGGYRKVSISPHLAYGESGVPPLIPPNAVLVYEIWLHAVTKDESRPRRGT